MNPYQYFCLLVTSSVVTFIISVRSHGHQHGRSIQRKRVVESHHAGSHPSNPGLRIWFGQRNKEADNAWVDDYIRKSQEQHERRKECEPPPPPPPPPPETSNNPSTYPILRGGGGDVPPPGPKDTLPPAAPIVFEDLPKSAKAFALFTLTFGCTKSEIYNQFLTLFLTMQATNRTENVTDIKDRQWLTALAEREIEVEPTNTTVAEAEATLSKLGDADRCALYEGELEMPIAARIFIHFVKVQSCADTKLETYKMFNQYYLEELAALPPRRYPSYYFLSKATVTLADHFPSMM